MLAAEQLASGWEFETIVSLVTNGGFGALVWYLIVKHMPAVEKRHEQERDRWMAWIDTRDKAQRDAETALLEALKSMSNHLAEYDKQLALLREQVGRNG